MAMALELHREFDLKTRVTPVEKEMRRRLFWTCYLMDRFMACGSKRPSLIADKCILLRLPSWTPGPTSLPVEGEFFQNGSNLQYHSGSGKKSQGSSGMLIDIVRILGPAGVTLRAAERAEVFQRLQVLVAQQVLDGVKHRRSVRFDRDPVFRPKRVKIERRHQRRRRRTWPRWRVCRHPRLRIKGRGAGLTNRRSAACFRGRGIKGDCQRGPRSGDGPGRLPRFVAPRRGAPCFLQCGLASGNPGGQAVAGLVADSAAETVVE